VKGSGKRKRRFPIDLRNLSEQVCLELKDNSCKRHSAAEFFSTKEARDPAARAARIADQFISQNRALFSLLEVDVRRDYDGDELWLDISSGNAIGAIPLFSPTTGRLDLGLVVQPRFPWVGIGPMLAEMGWRLAPTPLKLPNLNRSERRVPPWVLSSMILKRLEDLLEALDPRFELVREIRRAPRGTVDWGQYATRSVPTANFLSVQCTFSDLREDRLIKGAIRYVAEKQLRSLETQKHQGAFVHRLLAQAQTLTNRVRHVPPYIPSPSVQNAWSRRPMRSGTFLQGLEAIEWTLEERGLAGLSDLAGVPWMLPMDKFFESWVETVFCIVARRTGGHSRVGRKSETVHALNWNPSYLGSQKALIPDLWIEWENLTVVVDAKYKRHFEELEERPWKQLEETLREDHRADLLQVLAYAGLARTKSVVACLVYPCRPEKWNSLAERGRLFHKADVTIQDRVLHIWLTAIPMNAMTDLVSRPLEGQIRGVLTEGREPSQ
jgi:hypothetical protein